MTGISGIKLYEAVEALGIVEELILEHAEAIMAAGGDITAVPEIAELLEHAEGTFTEKVERVALKVRELKGAAEIVKAELDRLAARRKAYESAAEGLKEYLLRSLQAAGKTKVEGKLATVAIQKNPSALTVPANADLEELWLANAPGIEVVPPSFSVNKKVLLDAVKLAEAEGRDVATVLPNGWTVARGDSLRIR